MDIREVERKIKGCLGGTFTGKVAVRIIRGEIIACDVGEAGTGMPHLTHTDAMRGIVNMPEARARPPDLVEADAAAERANAAWEQAKEDWLAATDAVRSLENRAAHEGGHNATNVGYDGFPTTAGLEEARAFVHQMRKRMDEKSEEVRAARVRAHNLAKHYATEARLAEQRGAV